MSEAAADAEEPRRRSVWRLLGDRNFGPYFGGSLASNVGTWCHDIAAVVFVFQLTGLSSMVALVSVAGFGVSIVLAPLGGQLADRFDRRRLLLGIAVVMAVAASVLAAAVISGSQDVVLLLAVTFVLGVGRALSTPTMQAFLPSLVPAADLPQAAAFQSLTFNLARGIGPALGAALVALGGPGLAFVANAVSFIVFAVVLAMLHPAPRSRRSVRGGFLGGVHHVLRNPGLLGLILLALVVGMATDPAITLGPSLAERLSLGTENAGLFVTAFGMGSLLMAPFVGWLRRRLGPGWTCMAGLTFVVLGFVGVAFASTAGVALAAMVLSGVGYLAASSDVSTTLLELLDDGVRGRVMALWTMGFIGGRPIAALIDGAVSDAGVPQQAFLAMAGILAVGASVFALWLARSRDGLSPTAIRP
jgi:predicted MFS family arabinose efflux permease